MRGRYGEPVWQLYGRYIMVVEWPGWFCFYIAEPDRYTNNYGYLLTYGEQHRQRL